MNMTESIIASRQRGDVPVIAEIKRVIPKLAARLGRDDRDAALLTRCYEEGGAAGISLVTETVHFGGQPEKDIPAVLRSTSLPLLIKDFIVDQANVDFYHSLVSAEDPAYPERVTLLLIAHIVGGRLPELLEYIHQQGMSALVETRGVEDLPLVESLEPLPRLVGFNNKNIDELEIGDDELRLGHGMISHYRQVVGNALIVSESAHRNAVDVRRSIAAGTDAVLVGTAFLLSGDPTRTVAGFVRCGEE